MAKNKGKEFEQRVKADIQKLDNVSLLRLYDTTNGFKGISQPCDFVLYKYPNQYFLECKTTIGNTWSLHYTQYEKQKEIFDKHIKGIRIGVIIWFEKHDAVIYLPFATIQKMLNDGKVSCNIKDLNSDYKIIQLPSVKQRIYMSTDYSVLQKLEDGD